MSAQPEDLYRGEDLPEPATYLPDAEIEDPALLDVLGTFRSSLQKAPPLDLEWWRTMNTSARDKYLRTLDWLGLLPLQVQCLAAIARAWDNPPSGPEELAQLDLAIDLLPRTIRMRWQRANYQHQVAHADISRRARRAGTEWLTPWRSELLVDCFLALAFSSEPQQFRGKRGIQRWGDGTPLLVSPDDRLAVEAVKFLCNQAIKLALQALAPVRHTVYSYLVTPDAVRERAPRKGPSNATAERQARDPAVIYLRTELIAEILRVASPQQRQVVELRLRGFRFTAIGKRLHIDASTARRHYKRLIEKARELVANDEELRDLRFEDLLLHDSEIGSDGKVEQYPARTLNRPAVRITVTILGGVAERDHTELIKLTEWDTKLIKGLTGWEWDSAPIFWGSYRRRGPTKGWKKQGGIDGDSPVMKSP